MRGSRSDGGLKLGWTINNRFLVGATAVLLRKRLQDLIREQGQSYFADDAGQRHLPCCRTRPCGRWQCLDQPSAEALLRLRADPELQACLVALADKSTEGQLTPEEREEYETLICVGQFVALLQANAHRLLAQSHAA